RRHNRALLLDAPPATPLGTRQHLDARHRTVSCTGANTGVCTTAQSRHVMPMHKRRPSPEGYHSTDEDGEPGSPGPDRGKGGVTEQRAVDLKHGWGPWTPRTCPRTDNG